MIRYFWQKIKEYKLFIILGTIIILFLFLKLTSKKETITTITNTSDSSVVTNVASNNSDNNELKNEPTKTIDQSNEKKLTPEEISNLSEDDYFKYIDRLTEEEQKNLPPLAFYVNEAFPHEEDSFLAEKFENLKVYAKAKIDDKAKAERDLKYWFYIGIGITLPSDKIVWE